MGGKAGISISLIALALVALAVAGCGGSSSSATGATGTGESGSSSTTSSGSESTGGSEPAPGFSKKAKQASFGEEAEAAEREAASQILERNLQARSSGDFATQCETLVARAVEAVEKNGNGAIGKKKNCAEVLKAESAKAPPSLLENTMTEPVAALRVKGNSGYALYHGKGKKDFAMKMEKENGEWRVASLLTEEIPTG